MRGREREREGESGRVRQRQRQDRGREREGALAQVRARTDIFAIGNCHGPNLRLETRVSSRTTSSAHLVGEPDAAPFVTSGSFLCVCVRIL